MSNFFWSVLPLLALAACTAEPPAPGPSPAPPRGPLTAEGTRPITTPPAGDPNDPCVRWLDPYTKNTDLVQLYYRLTADGSPRGASDFRVLATLETERTTLTHTQYGVDKVVVTVPLDATYDAQKGVAHLSAEPLQGDSILFDTVARSGRSTLDGSYTLATNRTTTENMGSYPSAGDIGPPGQDHISMGPRYGVALLDLDPRRGGHWASAKGGLDVPLSPERNKAAYGRLSLKIVADLAPPGTLTGKETHPPTATSREWEVDLRYVTARTVCAAIVTANDGEPVKRLR